MKKISIKKIGYALLGLLLLAGTVVLALPTILHKAGLHPEYRGPKVEVPGKRALVITTSHAVLAPKGETVGPATGVFSSEFIHPYYAFVDAGMQVDVASINGGTIPIEPDSLKRIVSTPETERFLSDPVLKAKVDKSIKIDELDFADYDIIFLAGGWGAAYDLGYSSVLADKISNGYYAPRQPVIGGVCHGVLGLINARDREGKLLIAGRRMTGVTDKQIKELKIEITPQHPETELRKAGVVFESQTGFRDLFATHVTVDDEKRFVTGQNQNSATETAHQMMQIIAARKGS